MKYDNSKPRLRHFNQTYYIQVNPPQSERNFKILHSRARHCFMGLWCYRALSNKCVHHRNEIRENKCRTQNVCFCNIIWRISSQLNKTWWRHQMETYSALLAICARNSPVTGEFPTKRLVSRNFGVFFNRRLNKWLSKQSWGWWFETPSRPLWRHCNE